jgi:hypothetical protein
MTADEQPFRVAAEALRVFVNPRNRAPHLVGHPQQVTAILCHVDEIRNDENRAGVDEHFRRILVVAAEPCAPRATMHEDMDGRVRCPGGEDVHRFDRGRPIGEALGNAQPFAYEFAVPHATLQDSLDIWRIDSLIVGVIKLFLVHVEPDPWPFRAHRRSGLRPSKVRHGRQCGSARGQMQKFTAGKFHDISSKNIEGQALSRLLLMDFQIGNARQPLALALPLRSMGFRHVPLAARVATYIRSLTWKTGQYRFLALNNEKRCPLKCQQVGDNRTRCARFGFCRS